MADPTPINITAFKPYKGGFGKRFTASTTTGSTAYAIPGLAGGTDGNDRKRVLVTNGGDFSAFVALGPSDISATTDWTEILPRCAYLLTPPDVNPSGVFIAALTESGTTKIHAVAGEGT